MQFNAVEICTILLVLGSAVLIYLERKFPYRRGIPFFREGFWTDFLGYTLVQSFFLKILIFDYIIAPIHTSISWGDFPKVSTWPIVCQVLFFLITHDFYIYWFHRWQHANKLLWRTHEAHHSNKYIDWIAGARSHSVEILINQKYKNVKFDADGVEEVTNEYDKNVFKDYSVFVPKKDFRWKIFKNAFLIDYMTSNDKTFKMDEMYKLP